ncbi:hypothetical protein SAMD00019534_077810 [Acytostelium subglobosum LB1]|uniref:hypothetical protein n=1 Tax=Acytostelium subglobosum LB1 TaxID=1410327 RepID=UPI000644B32C|nr:hypothetical protein SAMD00019534_077810 [Acytostelium subglobosum LB1]GAM24606.1 hypothetical protein SAMD00019534_077810 [Acytostelium subglobosum LB1]|eukprot:XP_012752275.1 hypothetical protein SAMD00019534_077810 [Acytostelium subglobosum LB1]
MFTIYDYENFTREEYLDFFTKLLLAHYVNQIEAILLHKDASLYHSLHVEFPIILEGDVNFGPLFIAQPRKLLPLFHESLLEAQSRVREFYINGGDRSDSTNRVSNNSNGRRRDNGHRSSQAHGGGGDDDLAQSISQQSSYSNITPSMLTIKPRCRVRVSDLPMVRENRRTFLPRSSDYGLFVEFRGTVIRTGPPKVIERTKFFLCSKCKHQFQVNIDHELKNQFNLPKRCPNPKYCEHQYFKPVDQIGEHCDYQEIKVQENIHQIGAGSIPRSIIVIVQEDLVDSCQAGDDIVVSGTVIRRWEALKQDERCDVEIVLLGNHIRIMNEQRFGAGMTDELRRSFEDFWIEHESQPLLGRNKILKTICPGVYGMFVVKLATMMILVGGVEINDKESGIKRRGECHMLLVGEPGTGKSQFLKFAAKVACRSVLTTGIGTTSAGLTAAVVKEQGGEWMLEAGALVLADGGVCCIDEFSGICENDRATIHESMEQQTISIAKGGIVTSLHTRTSIIAATNAKGKYDESQSLMINTNLASPLLSRFDIILIITDDQIPAWDTLISEFILRRGQNVRVPTTDIEEGSMWNIENLQNYLYYIKSTFRPTLSPESRLLLDAYFSKQRTGGNQRNEARITTRLMESLIRLSQAHARLMFRNIVEIQDAIMAIYMVECSAESSCILSGLNAQTSIFPEDPELDYRMIERTIKVALGLTNISYKPSKRKKTKPREQPHRVNSSWVNTNLDDLEESDDDGYNGEEDEEEYEEVDEDGPLPSWAQDTQYDQEEEEIEVPVDQDVDVQQHEDHNGHFDQDEEDHHVHEEEQQQEKEKEHDISFNLDIASSQKGSNGSGGKKGKQTAVSPVLGNDNNNDTNAQVKQPMQPPPPPQQQKKVQPQSPPPQRSPPQQQQQQQQQRSPPQQKTPTVIVEDTSDLENLEFEDNELEPSQPSTFMAPPKTQQQQQQQTTPVQQKPTPQPQQFSRLHQSQSSQAPVSQSGINDLLREIQEHQSSMDVDWGEGDVDYAVVRQSSQQSKSDDITGNNNTGNNNTGKSGNNTGSNNISYLFSNISYTTTSDSITTSQQGATKPAAEDEDLDGLDMSQV